MGDPKLLKKYQAFSEAYRAEYAFEGTVEKLDTIDIIDPERLTRGLYVSSERGTRLISLDSKRKPPVEIGDSIIVVGLDSGLNEIEVLPVIILIPKGHYALLSRDIRTGFTRDQLLWNIPAIAGFGLAILSLLLLQSYRDLVYLWFTILGWLLYFVTSFSELIFSDRYRQSRLYTCDEATWQALLSEITSTFDIVLAESVK